MGAVVLGLAKDWRRSTQDLRYLSLPNGGIVSTSLVPLVNTHDLSYFSRLLTDFYGELHQGRQ